MPDPAYTRFVSKDKRLRILHGALKTPPMSSDARVKTGEYLRQLQEGVMFGEPVSKPMREIGKRCYELRINDDKVTWRIIYRVDPGEIVIAEVFAKKTQKTPSQVIKACRLRYKEYDRRERHEN